MAGKPAVQVEGAKEFRRAMKSMEGDLRDLTAIHRKAAQPVSERAQDLAPVVTGRLRRTVRVRATQSSAGVIAGNKSNVPYAGPIHFGWRRRNIEPQPFLYDALADMKSQVVDVYEGHVEELVRKVETTTPG